MLPILLRGIDVRQDSRIIHRQLQALGKIAANYRSGAFWEVLFQKFGEKGPAEENWMSSPSIMGRDHHGRAGFFESRDESPDGRRGKERVVYGSQQECRNVG